MKNGNQIGHHYDAIIVGARAAGAASAMLMARAGMNVLAIDRQAYGTDTMSTHALMRAAVVQLDRWGVLPQVIADGAPMVTRTEFHYGDQSIMLPIKPEYSVSGLIAPRRFALDRALVDAAHDSGATVVHDTTFLSIERGIDGAIAGIMLKQGADEPKFVRTALVIGADGRNSRVADAVGAKTNALGAHKTATIYGYFNDVADLGFRWHYGEKVAAGVIPTNNGQSCIGAILPPDRFRQSIKNGAQSLFFDILRENSVELHDEIADANLDGTLRGFPGVVGHMKEAAGPGWALVGDAGYFKDPCTAHGITDALRDAELVANAAISGPNMHLSSYQSDRDALSEELFRVTDEIASFDWDLPGVQSLHMELNGTMKHENAVMFAEMSKAA